jgi:sortase A
VARGLRIFAVLFALGGVALLAWVALTLAWGDPITALQTSQAQAALRSELRRAETAQAPARTPASARRRAAALSAGLRQGDAFGRIVVPRLGLRMVIVEGTRAGDLARGPGHYPATSLPGRGGTVAIAGHRTTHLQPFRHLDELRSGDEIRLEMPYGAFRYVVDGQAIVDDGDWSILSRERFEKLVLTACHPLYSAAQRIVVYARLAAGPSTAPR